MLGDRNVADRDVPWTRSFLLPVTLTSTTRIAPAPKRRNLFATASVRKKTVLPDENNSNDISRWSAGNYPCGRRRELRALARSGLIIGKRRSPPKDISMDEAQQKKQPLIGTFSFDNWRAFIAGEALLAGSECFFYTDARLTGEVANPALGPYALFNLVPSIQEHGRIRAALVLRLSVHVHFDTPKMDKTDQSRYHGGGMTDEIAALASLKCGIRLRSGGEARWFAVGGDPKGRPVAWSARPEPTLNIGTRGFVLPAVTGEHSIMAVEEMSSLPSLRPEQAIALVRSARLYQDALWLAESEPNLSWLLLVSAIETAANLWRSTKDSPLERLKESRPDFVKCLVDTGVEGLCDCVAKEFTDSIGATKKFVDFLLEHSPPPPEKRPPQWAQVDWSTASRKRAFRKIYDHRSKALHDGMPFPAPMCEPPVMYETSWQAVAERPTGYAMAAYGGTWLSEDTPMLLHTFEYIARYALNAWWSSMAARSTDSL